MNAAELFLMGGIGFRNKEQLEAAVREVANKAQQVQSANET
jgi:hypothetical protein